MTDLLLLMMILPCAFLGLAHFALAQKPHWQAATGKGMPEGNSAHRLKACGSALLLLSLALCMARDGPSFGAVLWVVLVSLAAMAVVFTLTWRPHWFRLLAR